MRLSEKSARDLVPVAAYDPKDLADGNALAYKSFSSLGEIAESKGIISGVESELEGLGWGGHVEATYVAKDVAAFYFPGVTPDGGYAVRTVYVRISRVPEWGAKETAKRIDELGRRALVS